jgi:type IV secretory pathway TraG/TraD family ATPase VirD4
MKKRVIQGVELKNTFDPSTVLPSSTESVKSRTRLKLHGVNYNIPITLEMLSQHILFTGGIGTGKTNAVFQVVEQIIKGMTKDDVMIIFDSKGDFLEEFGNKVTNPAIIGNDDSANVFWNMFNETLIDREKYGDANVDENLMELANCLFQDAIEKDSSNPFFQMAAKNVFYGILVSMYKSLYASHEKSGFKHINNKTVYSSSKKSANDLAEAFIQPRVADMLRQMVEYLGTYANGEFKVTNQGSSVMATMRNVLINIFKGNFAKEGDFSVRKFIRDKGARVLFVEYDISQGRVLGPIYKTILDLAIKEALSRDRSKGNVYFVIDEFRLLPKLDHMDAGVNLGRGLGAKFIITMQNLKQIEAIYGESEAKSILSGFVTSVNFRTSDKETRDYICSQFGEQFYEYEVSSLSGGFQREKGNAVLDSDVLTLGLGEAIISVPFLNYNPYRFKFKNYFEYLRLR